MAYSLLTKKNVNSKTTSSKANRLNQHDFLRQLILMPRSRDTERDAERYIDNELKAKKWNIANPTRNAEGEVYTQNQVNGHDELAKFLDRQIPENVVKIDEANFWVIEAKKTHEELEQALQEAIDYAKKINRSKIIKAKIATGVAGNSDDTFKTKSVFFDGKNFKPILINGKEVTGLLNKEITKKLIQKNSNTLDDIPIDRSLFLSKAKKINEILHLGGINKNDRAKTIASVLLSLVGDTSPNINATASVLIDDINNRAKNELEKEHKGNFAEYIKITKPPTPDNFVKRRSALVHTIQELESLDIKSAMNAGDDILGEFYEVFLKYGNGAKEIGIVLTPRHITRFVVDILNVNSQDIIYDPTCGTGGFLVASFDHVRKNELAQLEKFKENIFGLDWDPTVVVLAIVNMIFRRDGKTNIDEGDCFKHQLKSEIKQGIPSAVYTEDSNEGKEPVTKVLMNPPFALKTSQEKEYKFVDKALKQMRDGGYLFTVLPSSIMIKKGKVLTWRKNLLEKNTLLSVVTFPQDLFYPIGVHTVGVFIKKGYPHPTKQNVLWIRAVNDGFLKKKGERILSDKADNDLEKIRNILKSFIVNPQLPVENILEFQKACPIDFTDTKTLELVPEAYLDSKIPNSDDIELGMDDVVRQCMAYIIKSKKEFEI